MPQTGPDLVSAGYPISRPLLALLGGTGNIAQPNNPIRTNLDFNIGGLKDVSFASPAGSVYSVAVPVLPGDVITKISFVCGATSQASANVTNLWAALYTGTGSAPGTTGAQPTLMGNSASTGGSVVINASSPMTLTLATPVTVTSIQAPYGYIYAAFSVTTSSSAVSFVSMTCACAAQNPWYPTSPFSLYMSSNGATGASVPTAIGTATRTADPPVVLLS